MMNYAIGEVNHGEISIETVTNDPAMYVAQFEPIDVINGEQFAWNENGERFIFVTNTDYDNVKHSTKFLSVVNIGSWSDEGPVLQSNGEDETEILKKAVAIYLRNELSDLEFESQPHDSLSDLLKMGLKK